MKKRRRKSKNGLPPLRGGKVSLEDLFAPSYGEIMAEIEKKVGKRPSIPAGLPKGEWTEQALKVLEERYLVKDDDMKVIETPEEMIWRVAWEVASAEARWGKGKKEILSLAKDYYLLMSSRKFLPNSPTLMNAGTGNGLQYSACFVLPVDDSMEGIFDALKYQALIHKTGGGTGFAFSRLRPKGAVVKTSKGIASGPVSFMRIFDAATNEVKQGGKRRGANMGILRVDHPDIKEFIHCKEDGGITNFNISVAVTDKFMKALEEGSDYDLIDPHTETVVGKLNAVEVFNEIAEAAWRTGDPGLVFIDRINESTANPVPALGPIESTNPCVTGDTYVYTKLGLVRIDQLANLETLPPVLLDARLNPDLKWSSPLWVFRTGVKKVYKLRAKEGYEIRLTDDHKLMTPFGWRKAKELKEGDKILVSNRKGGFGRLGNYELGKILGWLVGDGSMKATEAVLYFFGREKEDLAANFARVVDGLVDGEQILDRKYPVGVREIKGRDESRVVSVRLWRLARRFGLSPSDKLKVPESVFLGSEGMQKGFLQALFSADGSVQGDHKKGASVRLTSVSYSLLVDVQRLLLNFGIVSKIYSNRRPRTDRLLPNGRGGLKSYSCREYHELVISCENIWNFAREIGFLLEYKNNKLLDLLKSYKRNVNKENFEVTFDSLSFEGEEPVYDLVEAKTHSFIANGFVVHNCGEQPLYPFDACNLGSVFLGYFVKDGEINWDELGKVVEMSIRFLDDVIEVNPYPLDQIRKVVFNTRRIGLGVGGWADMLVSLGIPYGSEEALELGEKVMGFIQEKAVLTTQKLAEERGPFPLWPISIYKNDKPRRNATVTTIAPTGTISIIAGASSGIEPLFAIAYEHRVKDKHLDRKLSFVNPMFENYLKKEGLWSEEILKTVIEKGVIGDMDNLPENIRRVFSTAHEIGVDWHIRTQSVFQKYTENAVSKTINLPHNATVDDVKKAYLLAWETDCKGITVFRDGSKDAQVLNVGLNKDENKQKEDEKLSSVVIAERPFVVKGATYKLVTPVGTAFITINEDERGEPLEVFINVGKAGSDITAVAEALGRVISTTLRSRGGSPKERAREIAMQLSGIGGRRSVGFGVNKIRSLPDAVAAALSYHFDFRINGFLQHKDRLVNGVGNILQKEGGSDLHKLSPSESFWESAFLEKEGNYRLADICPSCGSSSFVYEEGCSKCYVCGYSEC